MSKLNILSNLILLLIFFISWILSYNLCLKFLPLLEINAIIIEKEIISKPQIYINENPHNNENDELLVSNNKINNINKLDFYKLNFNNSSFLLSNDKKSYNYWFITKEIKNNILYLYSHNSYKYSENSWYYLYKNIKLNDIISFNEWDIKYKVIKTDIINFDEKEVDSIKIKNNVDIIYFTCTPLWWNIRKVYQLEKI